MSIEKILGCSKEQLNDSVLFWMREANKLSNTDIEELKIMQMI